MIDSRNGTERKLLFTTRAHDYLPTLFFKPSVIRSEIALIVQDIQDTYATEDYDDLYTYRLAKVARQPWCISPSERRNVPYSMTTINGTTIAIVPFRVPEILVNVSSP